MIRLIRGIITLLFGAAGLYLDYILVSYADLSSLTAKIGLEISLFGTYIFWDLGRISRRYIGFAGPYF